ncbi:tape measure protein [Faecalicoccus pleomorphus]|uniref:tape measure protein n=1 Tax=Faecalicoccus pleomorphus TaxID=1323 RepID=UPI0019602659|nr:tape measure protein [Faecalicoccus pleomorphus]MBM6808090.1 tape measure protein [Faecalicoccus pleomorphus]
MADSYSVSAILSATDKNMSSTFKNATQVAETFGDRVKSIVAGLGVTKALSAATNLLTSSLDGAITRYDTLHTYPKVMKSLGFSTEDAQAAVSKLNAAVQGLPTSLSDIVKNAQVMTSVTGDMNMATDTAIALNDALLSSSASTEDAARATQQYSQMLATGKPDLESWRTLQETMSPALTKVAKKLGIASGNTLELYNAMKDGKVSFDDFNKALIECDTETGGFAETAKDASKTIRTGFTNIKSAVENFEMSFIGAIDNILNSEGFGGIVDILDNIKTAIYNVRNAFMESSNGIDYVFKPEVLKQINTTLENIKTTVTNTWNAFKDTGAIDNAAEALTSVKDALANIMNSVDWGAIFSSLANWLGQVVTQISLAIDKVADFIAGLDPSVIDFFAQAATRLFEAFLTYKVVKTAANKIKEFGNTAKGAIDGVKGLYDNVKKLFNSIKEGNGIKGLFSKDKGSEDVGDTKFLEQTNRTASTIDSIFNGIAKTVDKAGTAIKNALEGVGDVFKSVGTAIADAAKGIGEGIKSALEGVGTVIESIGTAIKSVLEGLAPVIESLGTALATLAKGIGEGIAIALRGLGSALAMIPPTTWLAIGAAALMFGAALALVGSQGEGLQMVLNGVANVISSVAPIVQIVVNGIVSALSLLPGIFESVGTAIKTACSGISEVVTSLGTAVSDVVTSVTDGMSKIIDSIGNAISGVLDSLANIIDSIGEAALNAGKGFNELSKGLERITKLNLFDMAASMAAVIASLAGVTAMSGGLAEAGTGMKQFADGIKQVSKNGTVAATALTTINAAVTPLSTTLPQLGPQLTTVSEQIKTFADNAMQAFTTLAASTVSAMTFTMTMAMLNAAVQQATAVFTGYMLVITGAVAAFAGLAAGAQSAQAAISGLTSVASSVGSALSSLGAVGSAAMQSLVSSFREAQGEAESAGKAIGTNFTKSVQSGLRQLPSIAQSAVSSMISVLNSAQSAAYTSGAYIGIGLANGMRSQLGTVRAVAAQLAAAADEAIRAKARIGSPSKVADKNGMWIGQGLVNGIEGMYSKVHKAAYGLFDIPQLSNPKMAFAGINASLSDDYSYYHDVHYTIEVPLDVNGREFAKATYDDFDKEGSARAKIKDRIKGVR